MSVMTLSGWGRLLEIADDMSFPFDERSEFEPEGGTEFDHADVEQGG